MKAFARVLAVILVLSCTSLAQTAQTTQPAQTAQTTQPAQAATTEASQPETASAAPVFGPGMTLFVEPMDGFGQRVAYSITKKKVPVVLVNDREKADFVLSGSAHVHQRNFFTGFVLSTNGRGSILINDAHTGHQEFAYIIKRVDSNTTADETYQSWADACAKHLKKALEKEAKAKEVAAAKEVAEAKEVAAAK
ncbi:MAG TPA: hypothetical protein VMD97_01750 [Candidatus Aquilonibacter sp.]|nr:hypothetical protein [Candidatus Aquilonibacter sp.]